MYTEDENGRIIYNSPDFSFKMDLETLKDFGNSIPKAKMIYDTVCLNRAKANYGYMQMRTLA